jgi:hypothetical protein
LKAERNSAGIKENNGRGDGDERQNSIKTGQVEKESEVKFLRKSPTSKYLICEQ